MFDNILSFADYLKNNKVIVSFRLGLNLIFVSSISSYLFEKFYFKYEWYDFENYKEILNFFVRGNFFIPLYIFLLVWLVTYGIPYYIFILTNFKITSFLNRIIDKISSHLLSIDSEEEIKDNPIVLTEKKWYLQTYELLKESFKSSSWNRFIMNVENYKALIIDNFILLFRSFISVTLYYIAIDYFGSLFYAIFILSVVASSILLILAFQASEIFPAVIRRFSYEMEKQLGNK